ncbi:MAG: FAD-dependent oxidoreductase [bacterium]|nr:FAD-dependent oxidoreductase [bacterium]
MKKMECDVAVIGSGPAGLAAAISACDRGADKVMLIERNESLGGILQQCIHNGFGLQLFQEDLTGPEYAERFIAEVCSRSITCLLQTMVLELSANRQIVHGRQTGRFSVLAVSAKEGMLQLVPKAVVLAMGCRERTRGAIRLPGSRPAGIMTAGTAQRFINVEGCLPGREIVILGSGDIGMIMARRLHLEGCRVQAVVELNTCIGGLSRNLVQCLHDFNIPLYLSHTVTDVQGVQRVEGVDIAPVDEHGRPDPSKTFSIACDTLLLSVGLIPENELSRQVGVLFDPVTGGPVVDQYYQTSIAGIFAAGNVVQVFDLVDHVSICGMQAGESAARFARGKLTGWDEKICRVTPGDGIRCVIPQRLSGDAKDALHFYLRAGDVKRAVTLKLLNTENKPVFTKRFSIVRPPEMIHITMRDRDLRSSGQYTFHLAGEHE